MLSDELHKRLEILKKAAQDFYIFANSVDSKKLMKESDVTLLEKKIENLKKAQEENQLKANSILEASQDEAAKRISESKRMLEEAYVVKNQASEDKTSAQKLMNEAKALMTQALQRQKEADIIYTQMEERKRKIMEAVR